MLPSARPAVYSIGSLGTNIGVALKSWVMREEGEKERDMVAKGEELKRVQIEFRMVRVLTSGSCNLAWKFADDVTPAFRQEAHATFTPVPA